MRRNRPTLSVLGNFRLFLPSTLRRLPLRLTILWEVTTETSTLPVPGPLHPAEIVNSRGVTTVGRSFTSGVRTLVILTKDSCGPYSDLHLRRSLRDVPCVPLTVKLGE